MARMTVPLVTLVLFAEPTDAGEKCLIMGLLPAEDPKEMMAQYTPMKNWMAKEMGRCIKVFTATDYTGVIEAMRAKKVDFAWYGPYLEITADPRTAGRFAQRSAGRRQGRPQEGHQQHPAGGGHRHTAYKIIDDTDYRIVKDIKEAVDQLN